MTKDLVQQQKSQIGDYQGPRLVLLNSLSEIHNFATMVTKTDLVPKCYRGRPEDATVAIIYGMEIGLPPMFSLQNVSVVNGTPQVWGDAQLSLVQSSGKYEYHRSYYTGIFPNDDFTAIFEVKRIGAKEPVIKEYSVAKAKRANLWGKEGSWKTTAEQMLLYKAKAFALRECFADVLKGMHSKEEMEGEEMKDVTTKSKTAFAHLPVDTINKSFVSKPESEKPEVSEKYNGADEAEILEAKIEEKMEEMFETISKALKVLSTTRGINNYMDSIVNEMDLLKKDRADLYAKILAIRNNCLLRVE